MLATVISPSCRRMDLSREKCGGEYNISMRRETEFRVGLHRVQRDATRRVYKSRVRSRPLYTRWRNFYYLSGREGGEGEGNGRINTNVIHIFRASGTPPTILRRPAMRASERPSYAFVSSPRNSSSSSSKEGERDRERKRIPCIISRKSG